MNPGGGGERWAVEGDRQTDRWEGNIKIHHQKAFQSIICSSGETHTDTSLGDRLT